MADNLQSSIDAILKKVTTGSPRVAGVVAIATDRTENIYEGAAGKRMEGGDADMTTDTVFAIFSTTKAITGTAALQLVEDGRLELDAPAKIYAPDIGKLQVLEGFDARGQPRLRPPRRDVTTRMLLLHTAGFGYDFFNENYNRLAKERGQPSVLTATKAALNTPLLFDPGDEWEYGSNIDWVGQVVEGITGRRLGEVMAERIFAPLDMNSSGFRLTADMRSRLARMHQREADGSLKPMPDFELPQDPEVHMGGHALYSTVGDYCKFIRMWLNDGAGAARARPQEGDRAGGGEEQPRPHENQRSARRDPDTVELRGILPGHAEVLGADLHDQRRGCANRTPGGRARLGRPAQPLLLDRSQERHRRLLGDAGLPVRRSDLGRRLSRVRDRGLRRPVRAKGGVGKRSRFLRVEHGNHRRRGIREPRRRSWIAA